MNSHGYRGKNSGFSLNKLGQKTMCELEPTHSGGNYRVSRIDTVTTPDF